MDHRSRPTLEEQLKHAIRATGKTVTAVARGSGVTQPALCRFMNGLRSLKLESVERLCAYLGLALHTLEPETNAGGEQRAAA